jgi:membrane carboxypeptidase/penicillin-binding protein
MWAKFMADATKGDKPEWFRVPASIVSAEICPASGRLATTYCEQHRRQYFISGTQPVDYCDVHQPGLFKRILGLVAVKPVESSPLDVGPAATTQDAAVKPAKEEVKPKEPEAPPKKRGFWSRVFGRSSGK